MAAFPLSEDLDPVLWIEVQNGNVRGRCYLSYNCHTFRGRMGAWSEDLGVDLCVSKSEVINASREARYWIAGFLTASEPAASEMFGPAMFEAGDDDPRWQRWRAACAEFRETGSWLHSPWTEPLPFPAGTQLSVTPWVLRGDEIWIWNGQAWARADPQPPRQFLLLKNTICFERGHCDMQTVTTVHAVCIDCGSTSESVPGEFTPEEWERRRHAYEPEPL